MRLWQRLAIFGLAALEAWRWIKWLLGWGEHIDFVWHQGPKGVTLVADFLLNPPPGISFGLFLAALILWLLWNRGKWLPQLKHARSLLSPEDEGRWRTERRSAPDQPNSFGTISGTISGHDAAAAMRGEKLGSQPELSARDVGVGEAIAFVCFHQWGRTFYEAAGSPDVDGAAECQQFLQAAADGNIQVWGKRKENGVFEPIAREFWFENQIEWFDLLRDNPRTEPRFSTKHAVARYLDLMTSRAQVEKQWPIRTEPDEIASKYPNVRVADNPDVLALFDGDKLIPLLEAEAITSWGRPRHMGEPPPIKISGSMWRTHFLAFAAKGDDPGMRNQTFLKTKIREEMVYYDVFLNGRQLRSVWPKLAFTEVGKA
jgi:hypothetical protein